MKEQILKLRSEGKSYRTIEKIVGCSKSMVAYYCTPGAKAGSFRRRKKFCRQNMNDFKSSRNGCKFCGYNRCLDALDFHHIDPTTKNRQYHSIAAILRNCSKQKALEEIAKCVLLCAICHREFHAGFRDINGNLIKNGQSGQTCTDDGAINSRG